MAQAWGRAGVAWAGLSVVALGLLALGFWLRSAPPTPPAPVARSALGRASSALLAREVTDLELGMSLRDVLRGHPRIRRHAPADREGLKAFEERLGVDRRALYFFSSSSPPQLLRVQLASKLAGDQAVVDRVLELQGRLGAPSGVWDCPAAAGQLPTRRYQFKRGPAAALEVIALLGEHAAATFYVAAAEHIRHSLADARCQPTPPEAAARFPAVPPSH
jgi:hypothetical protein